MQKKATSRFAIFAIPNFKAFIIARFFFIFAAQMQFMLLSWNLYFTTKEVMHLGYLSLAELVPAFLLAFYGGYLVDKYSRKKIFTTSLFTSVITSFCLLSCFYLLQAGGGPKWIMIFMFISFMSGIIRVFASPSQMALFSEIIPTNFYTIGMSWYSGVWQVAVVTAPLLIGFLYKWIGLVQCQGIIFVCYVSAFLCSMSIKHKHVFVIKKIEETFLQSVVAGWKYVYRCKELLGSFTLDMFAVLFGGAVSLLPIFATEVFFVNTEKLGLLRSATPLGTILIILLIGIFPLQKKQGVILLWSIFLFGVCMIFFGITTNFWFACVLLFMSGIFDGINVVIRSTILQLKTTDEVKGKVSAIGTLFVMSSNELGAFESSIATKFLGLENAVVFGGCATIIVVGLVYFFIPQVKKLSY